MHEHQSLGNTQKARELLDKALEIDKWNGYVCHSYGLLEEQSGDWKRARQLWQQGLTRQPSAALICSLGHLYTTSGHPESARELYATYLPQLPNERERIEVYLAASSLEETVFQDVEKASQLLKVALADGTVQDSRAYMALARLGTSGGLVDDAVIKKRLKEICTKQYKTQTSQGEEGNVALFPVKDGRLFNAWAKLESKSGSLMEARKILKKGMKLYPKDHTVSIREPALFDCSIGVSTAISPPCFVPL
jgi:tetratricopeptide (TPR) repeat protein